MLVGAALLTLRDHQWPGHSSPAAAPSWVWRKLLIGRHVGEKDVKASNVLRVLARSPHNLLRHLFPA